MHLATLAGQAGAVMLCVQRLEQATSTFQARAASSCASCEPCRAFNFAATWQAGRQCAHWRHALLLRDVML